MSVRSHYGTSTMTTSPQPRSGNPPSASLWPEMALCEVARYGALRHSFRRWISRLHSCRRATIGSILDALRAGA
jgi:hypothetical protein